MAQKSLATSTKSHNESGPNYSTTFKPFNIPERKEGEIKLFKFYRKLELIAELY